MSHIAGKAGNVVMASLTLDDCEDAWNEQVVGEVTASLDNSDYKVGTGSAKFVLTGDATTGVIGSEDVGDIDISGYDGIMAWVKSSVALDANDFAILLDEDANCASPLTINIPALSANTWTLVRIAATFTGLDHIISVGINQTVDKGAMSFWIDDLHAYKAVAGIKAWNLDYTVDALETTDFAASGVREYIAGCSQWGGSFEGYKDGAPISIGSIYGLELRESATATQAWRGSALITGVHPSVNFDGVVAYSYDYQGTMELVIASA